MRSVARDIGFASRGSNEACWVTIKTEGWSRSAPVVQLGSWVQEIIVSGVSRPQKCSQLRVLPRRCLAAKVWRPNIRACPESHYGLLTVVVIEPTCEQVPQGPRSTVRRGQLRALCSTKMIMHGEIHFEWWERHHNESEI